MSRLASRARRAFTLVEILVAVAILGIIGAGLVRLILSQTRFTERQMASRTARTVSRNAMNIMLTDMRMVQEFGGLIGATRDSVTMRVPIAFGLACTDNILSLLPVDSAMTALGYYGGWAARKPVVGGNGGQYSYSDAATVVPFGQLPAGVGIMCNGPLANSPNITQVTYNGRTGPIVTVPDAATDNVTVGEPVFIYQIISYKFAASRAFTGRIGLFRDIKTGPSASSSDEIIAPFDSAAKFRFYVLNEDTAQSAVPADLNDVRGLQLYLAGSSPGTPRESTAPAQAALVTGVFFKNRRDP